MKVEVIIDESLDENKVTIYAKKYSKDIENLRDMLTDRLLDKIVAFYDKEIFILSFDEIIRIYAQDKEVFVKTNNKSYKVRLTLTELEKRLDKKKFIRISRSEIVNIDYIKRLDLSFIGTIAVEFTNGEVSYVSRRRLKNFKKILGL
ncbi:LytTR family DNA-binding domain-containing protein [uncultured Anaerococcus sp.]|uniref:LytTR family DNA-binding domain-containing protein n=1 Tax=uncultured Anaerococcus sp. TaxID=293428 RepID=UPI00280B8A75|nr:LytTR family DNA-binding domain-containing protein [uncultured Anaerococcus sp.]MDU5148979.1 LytTR family DNA-binding domain-containing protein [Anaerococcus prevotii]